MTFYGFEHKFGFGGYEVFMKKSLLGLSVALAAFAFGVFTVRLFVYQQDFVIVKKGEKIESVVVRNRHIPEIASEELSEAKEIEESEPLDNSQDINAWYSIDTYKKMPEVAMIKFYLTYYDDKGKRIKEPLLYSGVYTNLTDDVYESYAEGIQTKLTGNKLEFRTKKLKGIEYRFHGVFFKNKMMGEQEEKVLRGTLQKFVKGKKVAEVSGDFAYGEPYCLL